ncbi:MAG: HAD-IB family phosphatase [Verrucomicrobiota bacterium]|jgi:phosphoserine phosphatase|nr:MAG: HAD-IB family phosphatase [Verrucomicrobiota bacterium]
MTSQPKLICFDCDSTLSTIEGIDELARVRGPEVFKQVEAMTHEAMDGKIPVQQVFGKRLDIIKPTRSDVQAVGTCYLQTQVEGVADCLKALVAQGWTPLIISGGFKQAIEPLAKALRISRIEAVDLYFDKEGNYTGFNKDYPTTRSGGKPEVIERLRKEFNPKQIVMIGDGVSDLETQASVDLFVGFGGVVIREKVKQGAHAFITALSQLPEVIEKNLRK